MDRVACGPFDIRNGEQEMTNMDVIAESPCVDNCRLSDDNICLGCFLSSEEVNQWNRAGNQERLVILKNAYQRQKAMSVK